MVVLLSAFLVVLRFLFRLGSCFLCVKSGIFADYAATH